MVSKTIAEIGAVGNARAIFTEASTQFQNASANYADCVMLAYDARVFCEDAERARASYEATAIKEGETFKGSNDTARKADLIEWRDEDATYIELTADIDRLARDRMNTDLAVEVARFDISLAKRRMEFAIALLRNRAEDAI